MPEDLIPYQQAALEHLASLHGRAEDYIRQSKAENTRRAYRADWADFQGWCAKHALASMSARPATVALYLAERAATHKVSTLSRRLAAIVQMHAIARQPDPTKTADVREVWRGIRRDKGIAAKAKAPAIIDVIRELVAVLPDSLPGIRDRALLLIGFAGAFRRSELVALDVEDLSFERDGLAIILRRSKTDQESEGRRIGILRGANPATCPLRALQAWLAASRIASGPVFRAINRHGKISPERLTGQTVALVIKRYAKAAGLDASTFAGHSLRAGLVTSAAIAGVSERAIMGQTGHKNTAMVRRYIRDADVFRDNPTGKIGL